MQYIYAFAEAVPVYVPLGVMLLGLAAFLLLRLRFYGVVRRALAAEPQAEDNAAAGAKDVAAGARNVAGTFDNVASVSVNMASYSGGIASSSGGMASATGGMASTSANPASAFNTSAYLSGLTAYGDADEGLEPVSVVICCHDEGEALEQFLPAIMQQRGVRFEVIVVDDCSTDSTADVLKRYEHVYPNLRHTFVPQSARYVCHDKLAVSLGVKAAKYEWVTLVHADCHPAGDRWLATMSRHFVPEKDIVLGYVNYADSGTLAARRAIFERLMYQLLWFNLAEGRAIGGDDGNLAFRRSVFLARGGYAKMVNYTFGVDDLLVNYLARRGRTAVCCAAPAILRQQCAVTPAKYRATKMKRVAAQRRMTFAERLRLIPSNLMNFGPYLFTLGAVASAVPLFVQQSYVAAAAVCAVFAAVPVVDVLMFRRVTLALGEPLYVFSLPYYEAVRPVVYRLWKLRCRLHRNDYKRKI